MFPGTEVRHDHSLRYCVYNCILPIGQEQNPRESLRGRRGPPFPSGAGQPPPLNGVRFSLPHLQNKISRD